MTQNNEFFNNHGNELRSVMNALSGILLDARNLGACESACQNARRVILECVLKTPRKDLKNALASGLFIVLIEGGYYDVGYLLSERF